MQSVGVRIGCLAVAFQREFLLALKHSLCQLALARFALASLHRYMRLDRANRWGTLMPFDPRPAMAICPVLSVHHHISSISSSS